MALIATTKEMHVPLQMIVQDYHELYYLFALRSVKIFIIIIIIIIIIVTMIIIIIIIIIIIYMS